MQVDERKFELVKDYQDQTDLLPTRATAFSAGYDFKVARDTIIPSIWESELLSAMANITDFDLHDLSSDNNKSLVAFLNKSIKPTLVPTGIKVRMPRDNALFCFNRSSNPLKRNLVLANGVGIIDSDYYDNPDNEGQVYGLFYNLNAKPYVLKRGERMMQSVFMPYLVTSDDQAEGLRNSGFGSTGK